MGDDSVKSRLAEIAATHESAADELNERADEAFRQGGRDIAANVWRAQAEERSHFAAQLRMVIAGEGESHD